ncbi:PREDICTED: cell growth-regulating nucleolar protein [Polistes dominula]|uniref:Cell growth-regulating nucleolar protein n=1 Tax=Polistes dominula TaxID=743375 RepID=A0ABM1I4C6_POLDO|nr:PREDICTED: cell growth-regulating nucleolar protein [Polistes dominula]
MVVFTCNHCGETLQKPRVAKHYQFQCYNKPYLTCVDCLKDFHEQEYVQHTKCITEAERYGGKNYVPKAAANKGERKQQEWLKVVNNVLETNTDLSRDEREFLKGLSNCENVPRKKVKFINFVNNAFGFRTNKSIIESVWDKMEKAHQQSINSNVKQEQIEKTNGNHKVKEVAKEDETLTNNLDNNVAENQNNENICKESKCDNKQDNENKELSDNNCIKGLELKKDKKSKKRKHSSLSANTEEEEEEESSSAIKKSHLDNETVITNETANESQNENASSEGMKFSWKNTILNIVSIKGEISLKKLQKKVHVQYTNHCQNEITDDKFMNKFNKKLNKMTEVIVSEGKVKMA